MSIRLVQIIRDYKIPLLSVFLILSVMVLRFTTQNIFCPDNGFTATKWHIKRLIISDKHYEGVFMTSGFRFENDRRIWITDGNQTKAGTWKVNIEYSDDMPPEEYGFSMEFNHKGFLKELNGDWDIVERTGNKFTLQRNIDRLGTEYLCFEKM